MADVTIATPAVLVAPAQNWLGTQLIARGNVTSSLGGSPLTCVIQKQSDSSLIATGTVYTNGTFWVARFGPLTNTDKSTVYQVVANAPSTKFATSVTVQQLYFNPDVFVAFNGNTPSQFGLQFSVGGTYLSGSGYTVSCMLMSSSGLMVASGNVTQDQPQAGQWTASFTLPSGQSNCWLLAEIHRASPLESVAAAWIDGVNVTG